MTCLPKACGDCCHLGHPHDRDWCLHKKAPKQAATDYPDTPPQWCPRRVRHQWDGPSQVGRMRCEACGLRVPYEEHCDRFAEECPGARS